MTHEDFDQFASMLDGLRDFESIALLSPTAEAVLFPAATHLSRRQWNLDDHGVRTFDLIIGANVVFYATHPERWLSHVLACCRYFVMQDVIRRQRSRNGELGPDGDQIRFAIGREQPRVPVRFDLNTFGERLLGFRTYSGGTNEYDRAPLHFIAVIRGDLAEPSRAERSRGLRLGRLVTGGT